MLAPSVLCAGICICIAHSFEHSYALFRVDFAESEWERYEAFTQAVSAGQRLFVEQSFAVSAVRHRHLFHHPLGFVQVRKFGAGVKNLFGGFSLHGKAAGKDGMSSFQALTTAVAAQVGTGNITGCATALASGGPGAIFWMWVSAFFGMATIYAEAILAQTFKTTVDGQVTGGPIYYIRAAFKGRFGKFLAGFFSVAIVLALGFMGNMVQSNSISDAFHNAFGVNKLAVGIVVAVIAAFIFLGGVKRLASVTEKLVPVMALFYIVGCVFILITRWQLIPNAFEQILCWRSSPRPSPAAWPASPCGRPCATAWPAAVLQRGRHGLHPPTPTRWPRWKNPRTRASSP